MDSHSDRGKMFSLNMITRKITMLSKAAYWPRFKLDRARNVNRCWNRVLLYTQDPRLLQTVHICSIYWNIGREHIHSVFLEVWLGLCFGPDITSVWSAKVPKTPTFNSLPQKVLLVQLNRNARFTTWYISHCLICLLSIVKHSLFMLRANEKLTCIERTSIHRDHYPGELCLQVKWQSGDILNENAYFVLN